MNEKLDLILSEVRSMRNEQDSMKEVQDSMKSELASMKDIQNSMMSEQTSMKKTQNSMKLELASMKKTQDSMKSEIQLMKAQLDENTQLTKAIYYQQTEFEAKFQDEMTATKEQINTLATEQKAISGVLGEHEIAIRSIRNPIYKEK